MSLEVVRVFGVAARHGLPAPGGRRFGVPAGGAFDRESLRLANALTGNPDDVRGWELGLANVVLRATESGMASLVGAPTGVSVDGRAVPPQSAFPVTAGAEVYVGPPSRGARVYLAFRPNASGRLRRLAQPPTSISGGPFRVVAGPQADLFSPLMGAYRVGMASDRVGIRLEETFQHHEIELPSEPACVGAIQVTGDGGLLILGPDGPTIGGYPKVAVVIDADIDRLAQLRPGDVVEFEPVSLELAHTLRRERAARIWRQCAEIRAAGG